jgi:hypothetical protein
LHEAKRNRAHQRGANMKPVALLQSLANQQKRRGGRLTSSSPWQTQLQVEELESRTLMAAGLVAAYNFDEGFGTVLHDASGLGNNGTIANAVWSTAGKFGGALSFNGGTNSLVTVADAPSLNLTRHMTVEAWVDLTRYSSSGNWSGVIAKQDFNSANDVSYGLYADSGPYGPPVAWAQIQGIDVGAYGGSRVSLNRWAFLAETYDGTSLKLYVNGNLAASHIFTGSLTTTSDPLTIGQQFAGLIDNVRIYNTALSQASIRTDMNTPVLNSLTVSPGTLASATVNNAYSATLTATGGSGSYTFSVTSGRLPSWLTLNNTTGVLSGTPTTTGTSSFTITATDSMDPSLAGSKAYTLTVNADTTLTVDPTTLASAVANSTYNATLSATGGSGTYTFAVTAGSLPSWLTLNTSTGVLSGTPTTTGTSSFTITATDSMNTSLRGSKAYTLTVNAATTLTVDPTTLASAVANSIYNATLSATGGSGTYTFAVTAGSLPSWLTLNTSTGVLSGTPTTTGTSSFTITATDSMNTSLRGSKAYTLTVNAATTLTVDPTTLASAVANSTYNATLSATGGSGTYTFAVTAGSLPSWLTLNTSTGVLSGTPTTTGTSSFTISATDSMNTSLRGSKAYTLTVDAATTLTVAPATLASAAANSPYYATLSATGGSGSYTFAVTAGSLPSWLTLDSTTGVLSGTPTNTDTSTFTITATDSNGSGLTGSQDYTLSVNPGSNLTVSPTTLPSATVGNAYNATLSATGGSGSYTFAVTAGSLPSWLTLDGTTGVLSGTPTTTGTSSFTITATDGNITGLWGTQAYTLTVNATSSLTVSPTTLPGATANTLFSVMVSATGGSGTYTFAVTAGSLPTGLALNAVTGVLSGTPMTSGTSTFTITATDTTNTALQGSNTYTLTVNAAGILTVYPTTLASAVVGNPFNATLSATGGSGSYTFAVTAGSLPTWLTLNATTGVLSGTPTSTGTSTFTITATDSNSPGLTGRRDFTLSVTPGSSLTVNPTTLASATVNSAYSATLSATGGSGHYTFAVTAGSLPSWLTLNATTGVLSGTPTASGASTFTITATDSNNPGLAGSRAYTLTVNAVSTVTVSPTTLPNATANSAFNVMLSATGGSGSYTFAVTAGSLPSWLTLDATTGLLSGTPTSTGTSSFTITATDSSGVAGSQAYTLTVDPASSLTVSPGALASATPNSAYSASLSATGGSGSYIFAVTSGSLPAGISLNASTGVLSGTPPTIGTWSFTITATDRNSPGLRGSQAYALTVTSFIVTPNLSIPDFGANPTIYSVASGNWSNAATWSLGRLPTTGDIVDILPGFTVTYDVNSTTALNTVEIQAGATLTFRTNINTEIMVANFVVLAGGNLVVGTQANPIAANVTAQIVFPDQPLNTTFDPQQFGNGLIVLGNMTTYGTTKASYVTLGQEAHAGDTVLHLAAPATGWRQGDRLFLADTRQLFQGVNTGTNYVPQWEQPLIQSISSDGLTVTLSAALQYDHLGARDANGVLDYLPQVADMTRNVSIHSQNASGTRGYALFTYRADVNINYTGFGGMGRTTKDAIDDTTFDSSGQVTHVGTNQENRNPITFFDLIGPTSPQANGYQYTFVGNTISCPLNPMPFIWGINVQDSYYGLIQNNDLYNWAGAGVAVNGSSSYNRIDGNFVANVTGSGARLQTGLRGDGYWFANPNNHVTYNIATDINAGGWDSYSYGFNVEAAVGDMQPTGTAYVPWSQGADPWAGQAVAVNMNAIPLLDFTGNEVYGATSRGFATWWLGTQFETPMGSAGTLRNSVVWNQSNAGYFTYETNNLVIDGFVVRGDASQLRWPDLGTVGLAFGDYMTRNAVVMNLDIQDEAIGISVPVNVGRGGAGDVVNFTIANAYLRNIQNIRVPLLFSSNGGWGLSSRTVLIENVQFAAPVAALPAGWQSWNIVMDDSQAGGDPNFYNMTSATVVQVQNYNNVPGDNFQVFYAYNCPAGAGQRSDILGYVLAGQGSA